MKTVLEKFNELTEDEQKAMKPIFMILMELYIKLGDCINLGDKLNAELKKQNFYNWQNNLFNETALHEIYTEMNPWIIDVAKYYYMAVKEKDEFNTTTRN